MSNALEALRCRLIILAPAESMEHPAASLRQAVLRLLLPCPGLCQLPFVPPRGSSEDTELLGMKHRGSCTGEGWLHPIPSSASTAAPPALSRLLRQLCSGGAKTEAHAEMELVWRSDEGRRAVGEGKQRRRVKESDKVRGEVWCWNRTPHPRQQRRFPSVYFISFSLAP